MLSRFHALGICRGNLILNSAALEDLRASPPCAKLPSPLEGVKLRRMVEFR